MIDKTKYDISNRIKKKNDRKTSINFGSHSVRAGLLSTILMGAGQIYNRQYVKGVLLFAAEMAFIIFAMPNIIKRIHNLITLGDTPQSIVNGKLAQGDHSIFMMLYGITAVIILFVFILIYLSSIHNARVIGRLRDQNKFLKKIKGSIFSRLDANFPYITLTPAFLFTVFLTVIPLIFGIMIAFTNYSSPNHIPPRNLVDWVGFRNFINIFSLPSWNKTFYGVAWWTVIWALLATFTSFFVGLFFAVLVNVHGIRLKKMWRTIFILPWAMPSFISILIMRNMFNGQFGPINKYLMAIGLKAIPWFADPFWAKTTCVIVNMWFGFPYFMALMSGVISGISKDLYESARIEGANQIQQFRLITLPMVLFATAPLLIMSLAGNLNNFNLIYLLTSGGPVSAKYSYAGHTDILLSWIYKLTLDQSQFHMASVVSILIFIVIASISIFNFMQTRSFKEEDMIQ